MKLEPRVLAPALAAFADTILTIIGQPSAYHAGDLSKIDEFNPVAHCLLHQSLYHFAFGAIFWIFIFSSILAIAPRAISKWMSIALTCAHLLGVSSWLIKPPFGYYYVIGLWTLTIFYILPRLTRPVS